MGLLNFWHKEESDPVPLPPLGSLDIPTDLPSIDGSALEAAPESNTQTTQENTQDTFNTQDANNDLNNLPVFDLPSQEPSLSAPTSVPPPLNQQSVPASDSTLDFSMPSSDDTSTITEPIKPTAPVATEQKSTENLEQKPVETAYLDVDDLKRLFPGDDWKEPDWNTFEPYHEDTIDEPHLEDFGKDLPNFVDEEKISEPQPLDIPRTTTPVELFIRGREYNKVFLELDQMTKSITKVDSLLSTYEDILKREESVVLESKNQMEYLYKKLTQIDKKIFAQ